MMNELDISIAFWTSNSIDVIFRFFSNIISICYGLFILLVEYVVMDPDSARHASALTPHTVYSLAGFQSSNHIQIITYSTTPHALASFTSHISYAWHDWKKHNSIWKFFNLVDNCQKILNDFHIVNFTRFEFYVTFCIIFRCQCNDF